MKFGLIYEVQRPMVDGKVDENLIYKETLEQCVLAEEMGFDHLWFVEHHFLTGFSASPAPEILFGALSQITKRIRIGFGVSILPYHHPVQVAERVALVDQLTDGRVELGTGRSTIYEQTGLGVDPRDTRDMWEESISMIPQIWQSEEFSHEGRFWNVPPRRVLPKPYQKPHPPMWMACLQSSSYALAAERGLGVLSSASYAPSVLAGHIKTYRENLRNAKPVGAFVNDRWSNTVFSYCGEDNREARELCLESIKTFYGPDKPYTQARTDVYEDLLAAWGGVPDHLKSTFAPYVKEPGDESPGLPAEDDVLSLEGARSAALSAITQLDADTLCDRGVLIAGDPESCIKAIRMYEDTGLDQIMMMMQTETVPHEKVMRSIEMFGKYVLPTFRQAEQPKAEARA